jgi:hypothetical protein
MERLRRTVMGFGARSRKAAVGESAGVMNSVSEIIALIKRKKSILAWGNLRILHFTKSIGRP